MVVIMGWGGGDTKDLGEVAPGVREFVPSYWAR